MPRRRNNVIRFRRAKLRLRSRRSGDTGPRAPLRKRIADPQSYLPAGIGSSLLCLMIPPLAADRLTAISGARAEVGCRVVQVIDGDTVRMRCTGRGVFKARLTGCDTPEKFSPRCASELRRDKRATRKLRRLISSGKTFGAAFRGFDRYCRTLVEATLDGAPISRTMIASGDARPYDGGVRDGWCGAKQ